MIVIIHERGQERVRFDVIHVEPRVLRHQNAVFRRMDQLPHGGKIDVSWCNSKVASHKFFYFFLDLNCALAFLAITRYFFKTQPDPTIKRIYLTKTNFQSHCLLAKSINSIQSKILFLQFIILKSLDHHLKFSFNKHARAKKNSLPSCHSRASCFARYKSQCQTRQAIGNCRSKW